jgi:hypothetical protein
MGVGAQEVDVAGKVIRFRNRLHLAEPALRVAELLAGQYGVTAETVVEALLLSCAERDLLEGDRAAPVAWPEGVNVPHPTGQRLAVAARRPREAGGRGRVISLASRRRTSQPAAPVVDPGGL